LLAVLLAVGPSEPQTGPWIAVAGGAGVAYGRAGAHLELLAGHFGIFGGIGYDTNVQQGPSFAAGLRAFSGRGEGAMLSLNFAMLPWKHIVVDALGHEYSDVQDVYLGATIGWRATFGLLFFEAGLGPAWLRARNHGQYAFGPTADPDCVGTWPTTCDHRRWFVDLSAALGAAF
jgi:hypothetical protein